jgi:hypothetical protein
MHHCYVFDIFNALFGGSVNSAIFEKIFGRGIYFFFFARRFLTPGGRGYLGLYCALLQYDPIKKSPNRAPEK